MKSPSLDELWSLARPGAGVFDAAMTAGLPEPARRYLEHAIAGGAALANAVRLRMHGEIRIKGWHPFAAEQVIVWNRGMIWRAAVRMFGMPVRGGDFFLDGQGMMRWRLFGLLPLVNAAGPDIGRSAAGRMNIESIWLPCALCGKDVAWSGSAGQARARFSPHGEDAELDLALAADGGLRSVSMQRWGDPDGRGFRYCRCGGLVEEEKSFGPYTIPSRLRVGWHFGSERFATEGEFFRVTVDSAEYR